MRNIYKRGSIQKRKDGEKSPRGIRKSIQRAIKNQIISKRVIKDSVNNHTVFLPRKRQTYIIEEDTNLYHWNCIRMLNRSKKKSARWKIVSLAKVWAILFVVLLVNWNNVIRLHTQLLAIQNDEPYSVKSTLFSLMLSVTALPLQSISKTSFWIPTSSTHFKAKSKARSSPGPAQ